MTSFRHASSTRVILLAALVALLAAVALSGTDGSRADAPETVSLLDRPQVASDVTGLPSGDALDTLSAGAPEVSFEDARRAVTPEGALWAAGNGDDACFTARSPAAAQPWATVCGPATTLDTTGLYMVLDAGDTPAAGAAPGEVTVLGLVPDDTAAVQVATDDGDQTTLAPRQSTIAVSSSDPVDAITVVHDDGTTDTINVSEGN